DPLGSGFQRRCSPPTRPGTWVKTSEMQVFALDLQRVREVVAAGHATRWPGCYTRRRLRGPDANEEPLRFPHRTVDQRHDPRDAVLLRHCACHLAGLRRDGALLVG